MAHPPSYPMSEKRPPEPGLEGGKRKVGGGAGACCEVVHRRRRRGERPVRATATGTVAFPKRLGRLLPHREGLAERFRQWRRRSPPGTGCASPPSWPSRCARSSSPISRCRWSELWRCRRGRGSWETLHRSRHALAASGIDGLFRNRWRSTESVPKRVSLLSPTPASLPARPRPPARHRRPAAWLRATCRLARAATSPASPSSRKRQSP